MTVDLIIQGVLEREGSEFTNNPNDSGGPTKYGITQQTLSRYRKTHVSVNEVRSLTQAEARSIYFNEFVDAPGFRVIMSVSPKIAEELVDTGVNTGPARASEMLQRCLNALNRNQRDYPDVKVDGACGAKTVAALHTYLKRRGKEGEIVLLRALNALQGEFYLRLAEGRPKDEDFVYGWLLNRVVIE